MDLIDQARALRIQGSLTEAVECYQEILGNQPRRVEALHELGTVYLLQGRPEQALALIDRALREKPDDFDALMARANTLFALKRQPEAIHGFDEALRINPRSAEAHHNRGAAMGVMGEHAQALRGFEKAIELKPDYIDAHNSRGNAHRALGRAKGALESFERAFQLSPTDPTALLNQASVLRALKRNEEALQCLDQAIALKPNLVEAHVRRGGILEKLKRYEQALESVGKALALKPREAKLHFTYGRILVMLRRYAEALTNYNNALAIQPNFFDAFVKRAQTLLQLQRPEEALQSFESALAIRSDRIDAIVGRGFALSKINRWREGMACYDQAILLEPRCVEAHGNLALSFLTLGDLAAGWERWEWRWKHANRRKQLRKFPQPRWLGQEPVAGKTVFIYHEQGFGDTIQFVRYIPLLAAEGARVILQVQTPLLSLLGKIAGAEKVIGQKEPLPSFDLHCPLLSLPLAFSTTLQTIPSTTPYLFPSPERIRAWSERIGSPRAPRVGIAWSGNPQHPNDRNRSITLQELLPLSATGVELVSVQKDVNESDRETLRRNPQIRDLSADIKDFADTAAVVSILDLVISVDTAPAHLAGALAKPVWVLLMYCPDWRWMLDREDSPWYPTARLFRQSKTADWASLIRGVAQELRRHFQLI